jgi:hypothetical protein
LFFSLVLLLAAAKKKEKKNKNALKDVALERVHNKARAIYIL